MHDEDPELIEQIVDNILWALDQIQKRFGVIHNQPGESEQGSISARDARRW